MTKQNNDEQRLRQEALFLATKSMGVVEPRDSDAVIADAEKFYKFLTGSSNE